MFSVTVSAAQANADEFESSINVVSFFQKIIDMINDFFNKIKVLFGMSTVEKTEPLVPVTGNTAYVTVNFGAYGDGIHDDTKAIQNALDYMKSTNGTIYFPDGVYLVSACLIFYSNQNIVFDDNAVLKRMETSEPTRYLLASYTSSDSSSGEYNGVHDVKISGGIFDGNADVSSRLTMINLCHAKNITIAGMSFINGSFWHYIEIASSKDILITDCMLDGNSYTSHPALPLDELIQVDVAKNGNYGPIYNINGDLIDYVKDEVPCVNIEIKNCMFNCYGAPGIGEHNGYAHSGILIHNNEFYGLSGRDDVSNGYVKFMKNADNIEIYDNIFNSSADDSLVNDGVVFLNDATNTNKVYNNIFNGYFSMYYPDYAVTENNIFN